MALKSLTRAVFRGAGKHSLDAVNSSDKGRKRYWIDTGPDGCYYLGGKEIEQELGVEMKLRDGF